MKALELVLSGLFYKRQDLYQLIKSESLNILEVCADRRRLNIIFRILINTHNL